jgi:RNA polymerase sigma-70 factor, ECF subfamily
VTRRPAFVIDGFLRRKLQRQSDERLAALIAGGSPAAVDALQVRYHDPLACYCARVLGAPRCDGAAQATLARAYASLREGIQPLRLRPWLFAIAVEVCREELREDPAAPGEESPAVTG